MGEGIRLQKVLSQAGIASRRRAEELIRAGRVRVNGALVTELGTRVDERRDRIEVDGARVEVRPVVWLALHKPAGYVTTRRDPQGRPTIYELLPEAMRRLFHAGRLDFESEGLVLLTNEGAVANRLMHPRYGTEREYEVEVRGEVSAAGMRRLKQGVELDDGPARAEDVKRLAGAAPGCTRLRVTLKEGRKREVRRMFSALGRPVERLVRVRYGPVRLGDLAPGRWRRLTEDERLALSALGREAAS